MKNVESMKLHPHTSNIDLEACGSKFDTSLGEETTEIADVYADNVFMRSPGFPEGFLYFPVTL